LSIWLLLVGVEVGQPIKIPTKVLVAAVLAGLELEQG
jgi:hypothetical protein